MAVIQRTGLTMLGAATTMLARRVTRVMLHREGGQPKLPGVLRRNDSVRMMFLVAGAAGVVLALGDVLQEQRKRVAQRASDRGRGRLSQEASLLGDTEQRSWWLEHARRQEAC